MYALVYVSCESFRLNDQDMENLLRQSRRANKVRDITGLLLFKDGNFMQLIEGPEEAVRATFAKIKNDRRHQSVKILLDEKTAQREFGDWSMGYRKLGNQALGEVEGYSDFLEVPLTSERFLVDPPKTLRFLKVFKNSML